MTIDTMATSTMASTANMAAAGRLLNDMRLEQARRPGGSSTGRLMRRSRTRTAGIRFEWVTRTTGPVLRVVATWTDRHGQPHHTSFSVQCNGLEGALDRAIAARCSCGAPLPDREDLLQRLRQEFATAPLAADLLAGMAPGRTLLTAQTAQGSLASMAASVASSQANG
ncbi:hypothetical protein J2X20_001286 [Pelomonas saccharophila]|uniref:Uncharacterized protein n=1 Tax=Roseateles saccharophilus TaxID=304 RepID=A0ABU1YIH9_ROSSA|nr:hypothetical protein [Roseateles saccharophilus]MDR7268657.1 hypothetical protein [Roseateles saccharophilus]